MSLLFIDGANVDLTAWDNINASRSGTGRYGDANGCIAFGDTANGISKGFTASTDVYVGFAHLLVTTGPNAGNRALSFWNADGEQVRIWHPTNGEVRVSRLDGTQLATVAGLASLTNRWVYYEVYYKCADSGGRVTVKMDGTTIIDFTGDTKNGATATDVTAVYFGGSGGSTSSFIDDVYVCNGLGTTNNTFLGELRVMPMLTTGAGSSTQWTPSTGSNWDNVNDTNTDTTYNSSSTETQRDLYAMADTSVGTTVFGVQVQARMKKSDAGAASARTVIKSSSTVSPGALRTLSASALNYTDVWEVNPATSTAWSQSSINALEVGVEIPTSVPAAVANWPVTETSGTTITDTIGGVVMTLQGDAAFASNQLHGHSVLRTNTTVPGALDLAGGGTAPEPSTAITVMCWVRTTTNVPSSYANAISKATTTYDSYGLFVHYGAQNTPACQFRTATTINGEVVASSALLADHAWHHLAMTYDGTTVKLYCDATQVGSATTSGTLFYYAGDRLTFMGNDQFGNKFVGDGAEFRIYDVALTQAQITTAMAG